jgi:hypothetical protein
MAETHVFTQNGGMLLVSRMTILTSAGMVPGQRVSLEQMCYIIEANNLFLNIEISARKEDD